ncbi:hypothetical protein [Sphingobacterium mizutaii]|uniref:hypothetical protein n=1 Tax=Sphingobacterium mizutaii TaxID=1010 RepID=UPI001624F04C|nr:hypothetical protein [Sphingobacterium mizutaii]
MKKLSILFALILFFVCGTTVSASASEIAENPFETEISTGILDYIKTPIQSNPVLNNNDMTITAIDGLGSCTITVVISCGDIGVEVEVTADTCAEAGAVIDDIADKTDCG